MDANLGVEKRQIIQDQPRNLERDLMKKIEQRDRDWDLKGPPEVVTAPAGEGRLLHYRMTVDGKLLELETAIFMAPKDYYLVSRWTNTVNFRTAEADFRRLITSFDLQK